MRLITLVLAAVLAAFIASGPVPALALDWKEYAYPNQAFTVHFPQEPTIGTVAYTTADGRAVEAQVYSVTEPNAVFTITVAEFPMGAGGETAEIDHAVKTLIEDSEIKVDIPHRIRTTYGRQLAIDWKDGSNSMVAVFYHKDRLYQLEGKALPIKPDARVDAMIFHQSLDLP